MLFFLVLIYVYLRLHECKTVGLTDIRYIYGSVRYFQVQSSIKKNLIYFNFNNFNRKTKTNKLSEII